MLKIEGQIYSYNSKTKVSNLDLKQRFTLSREKSNIPKVNSNILSKRKLPKAKYHNKPITAYTTCMIVMI